MRHRTKPCRAGPRDAPPHRGSQDPTSITLREPAEQCSTTPRVTTQDSARLRLAARSSTPPITQKPLATCRRHNARSAARHPLPASPDTRRIAHRRSASPRAARSLSTRRNSYSPHSCPLGPLDSRCRTTHDLALRSSARHQHPICKPDVGRMQVVYVGYRWIVRAQAIFAAYRFDDSTAEPGLGATGSHSSKRGARTGHRCR